MQQFVCVTAINNNKFIKISLVSGCAADIIIVWLYCARLRKERSGLEIEWVTLRFVLGQDT